MLTERLHAVPIGIAHGKAQQPAIRVVRVSIIYIAIAALIEK